MDSYLMFLNCPAYMDKDRAARCGLPAEVHCRYTMNSTDGPLEGAKISCPRGHHFNGPIDCLTVPEQPAATAAPASPPPAGQTPNHALDGRENDHDTAGTGQLPARGGAAADRSSRLDRRERAESVDLSGRATW